MAYNKIITSEGNVQFQTADGNIINVHPFHIYTTFNEDTVSFILIAMPKYSGLAIFTSKASDLEVDGTVYTIEQLPNALSEAFAKAGAVARYEIVDELPTSGQSNTIYLVPKSEGVGYDEYIYVNGEWELIGDTDVEFDKYLTKEAFSAYSAATELKIDGKVVELTQAEYDAMVSGGTIDPLVLYVITDAVEVNMNDYYKKTETSGATELSTAFANEASARTDADTALQGLIDVVSGNVETETSRAESAETALDGKIEIVSGQVISETSRAESAETALDGKIDIVSGAVEGVQDEVDIISASLEDEVSARTDADTALQGLIDTVSGDVETLSGSVESLGDNKANKSEAVASAAYVSSSATIDLKDISGNVISQVDASDFIIDGMVDDVKIENGYLVITFNTDSGKQDIQIPLTDIFDPSDYYDKTAIDNIVSGINESIDTKFDASGITAYSTSAEVTAEINAATSGKVNTSDFETYSGNVETALDAKLNTSDFNTYSANTQTAINGKQDTLISGTNIKTINNESILGSGNIDIQGGGKTIEAGRGISITTSETADTINCTLNITNGTGLKSIVISNGKATGTSSFAIGDGTKNQSLASEAKGITSFSCGLKTIANKNYSAAFGDRVNTNNANEFSCGRFNNSVSVSTTLGDSGNTLFSVGNGTADNARHNAFEIRQNGDIYLTKDGQDVKLQDQLGGGSITVDTALDSGSTNAVANSAITIAIDELSASSVTNCDNVVIEDAIPTPPSTIVDENVKVSWEDDYTETYAVDYEGGIGDGVEHVRYNVSKLEFGSFTTGIGLNFRFSSDDCYRDLKTVIFNGNVNFGEENTAFASAFNLEAVYFYAPNPSAITSNYSFSWDFLNSVYDGCETYETSAATYLIYVADLAAYSGARLYSDGGDDVTWGQHFGNRLQEIPKDKKLVLTDIDSRLAEDEEVTASGLNALNDKFDGLKLKKLTQAEYDALVTKDANTLYIVID